MAIPEETMSMHEKSRTTGGEGVRLLITGSSGFVARHFLSYINDIKEACDVICIDATEPTYDMSVFSQLKSVVFFKVNLLDVDSLERVVSKSIPDYVLHLAAFSSVAYSWDYPKESFLNNCNIFLNLCSVVKKYKPDCRILSVGSSEEYGIVRQDELPIRETQSLNPISPYAAARVSQEILSKIYAESMKMQIVMTRSFNHIGPGQDERFVVPGFIKRILDIKESGDSEGTIETGNIEIIRDFVDVRDVVRAYYILLNKGKVGEIYNICAGRRMRLKDIIDYIANQVGINVRTKINSDYVRPNDNPEIVGTYYKIEAAYGWKPEIPIERTLEDMITYMRNKKTQLQ